MCKENRKGRAAGCRLLLACALLGSLLAAVKCILVGYCQDEEYQLVMAYRSVTGDRLFATMWEPHQMSAMLQGLLIRFWLALTGSTTGILLFLRFCGTLFQAGIGAFFYCLLKKRLPKIYALLLAVIYWNTSVGLFASAEYSNQEFWFLSLLVLFFYLYVSTGRKRYLLLAAGCQCMAVLAFPGMVFLAPVCAGLLWSFPAVCGGIGGIAAAGSFLAVCGGIGCLYCLLQIRRVGLTVFLETIPYILTGDPSHSVQAATYWTDKFLPFGRNLLLLALAAICVFGCSRLAGCIWRRVDGRQRQLLAFLLSLLIPTFSWLILGKGFETGQLHIWIAGICLGRLLFGSSAAQKPEKPLWFAGILTLAAGLTAVLFGFLLSNMDFMVKLPHAAMVPVAFLTLCCLEVMGSESEEARNVPLKERAIEQSNEKPEKRFLLLCLFIYAFFLIFAKGYTLRSGADGMNNIFSVQNVSRKGPAVGVFTDYMHAYILDADYEEWKDYVKEGDRVLIVTQTLHSNIITAYLYEDVTISHYSMLNPFSYTPQLLTYWEKNPDHAPNVIAVDCWYGDLLIDPDSWIMQYVENEFGYTWSSDGKYLRYYRKESSDK